MHGFVCESEQFRNSWLYDTLWWNFKMGMNSVVLFESPNEIITVPQRKNEMCLAGQGVFRGGKTFDPALEVLLSSESIKIAAKRFSKMVVRDEDVASAKESFWPQSARIVLMSLFDAAVCHWAVLQQEDSASPVPTLTRTLFTMVSELLEAKLSMPYKNSGVSDFEEPLWWEHLSEKHRKTLVGLVIGNAPQTTGCIFAELGSFIENFSGIVSDDKTIPYFAISKISENTTIFVHVPSVGWQGLSSILEICFSWKNFSIVIPNVSTFYSQDMATMSRYIEKAAMFPDKVNVFWTASHGNVTPVFLGGNVSFGPGTLEKNVSIFRAVVHETLGVDSGCITSLPYETPVNLPDDMLFSLKEGKWSCEEFHGTSPCISSRKEIFGDECEEKNDAYEKDREIALLRRIVLDSDDGKSWGDFLNSRMVEDTHASNDEETKRRAETEKNAEIKENEEILRRIESVVSCSEALLEEELTAKEVDSESELPERELPESEFLDTFGFNFGDTESSEETETPQPEDAVSNEPKRETRGRKKKKGE